MIKEDLFYRKIHSADFVRLENEEAIIPVRFKNDYVQQDEYFDFEKNVWLPLLPDAKFNGNLSEFVEYPYKPRQYIKDFNPEVYGKFEAGDDITGKEMAQVLEFHRYLDRMKFNRKNFLDSEQIEKDLVKVKITTDTGNLTLKITFTKFARDENAEPHFETEIPQLEAKSLVFDMKNGTVDFAELQNVYGDDKEELCEEIQEHSPAVVLYSAFERLLNLAELYTGISFETFRALPEKEKTNLYQFYKITMLPFCPELYEIINSRKIKKRHVHFHYKRSDSKIFKHFCRKYKIRNTKTLRKCFMERPEVLLTFLQLKDAGFRDMNLYNRVITNKENWKRIDYTETKSLAFFCHYSMKKRSQKATMNTILKDTGDDYNLFDGLEMFEKYFKHIPETLKNDILEDGFTDFNHNALSTMSYQFEHKKITFSYTDEQKKLEDEIDGFSFCLPESSYQLCEIGNMLHNCVASFADAVKEKRCTIVYAKKGGEYKICIELRDNVIHQERIDHNKQPEKDEQKALQKWHERHGLVFDRKHRG